MVFGSAGCEILLSLLSHAALQTMCRTLSEGFRSSGSSRILDVWSGK